MSKLRKGDTVIVIAGKDKGKQGTVQAVKNDRIKVEGINIVTKHQKPNQATGVEGGILKQEAFLHISNVAILNAQTHIKCDFSDFRHLHHVIQTKFFFDLLL